MKRTFLFIALFGLFFACSPESERLHDDVMAVHDEVMPKMDDIMKEKARLTGIMNETDDSLKVVEIRTVIAELNSADEGMMQWMREFKPDKTLSEDELTAYYKTEMERISKVRDDMLNALERSREMD